MGTVSLQFQSKAVFGASVLGWRNRPRTRGGRVAATSGTLPGAATADELPSTAGARSRCLLSADTSATCVALIAGSESFPEPNRYRPSSDDTLHRREGRRQPRARKPLAP